MTLRGRLLAYSLVQVGALGLVFLVAGTVIRSRVSPLLDDFLLRKTERTAMSLASRLEIALGSGDAELARSTVAYLSEDPDLVRVEVRDRDGKLFTSLGDRPLSMLGVDLHPGLREADDAMVMTVPIEMEGYALGTVSLAFSKERKRAIARWMQAGGVAVLCACLIAIAVAFRFSRAFVAPIHRMIQFSHRVKEGGLSERVVVAARDGELSRLAGDLNIMAAALEARDQVLAARGRELEESLARMREMLHQLKEAQQQLVHAEKFAVLGQTAATVAHEINNPAAFMEVNLEVLADTAGLVGELCRMLDDGASPDAVRTWRQESGLDAGQAEMAELVAECQDGLRRILVIVRDLKSFARSRESDGDVQLVDVVDRVLRIMGNEIRHRARVIMLHREPAIVRADEGRLMQVLMNLLGNALQSFGSRPPADNLIEVSIRAEHGSASLSLRDNGCGIPPEIHHKIFEPFFTTKAINEGSGLGLSICRSIVEQHRGTIAVESEPGVGSLFKIVLPAV
jgi:C4-dicarboxylate-specific signal transduction histidine kinase